VPLYTRVISGTSVEQGSEYGSRQSIDVAGVLGDETEDMYTLLSEVKVITPYLDAFFCRSKCLFSCSLVIPTSKVSPWVQFSLITRECVWNTCKIAFAPFSIQKKKKKLHRCRRLSLVPLCYLWQRDQCELIAEMIECGMVAILIKVAGIGLAVDHLGKSLSEMQPTLLKLVRPLFFVFVFRFPAVGCK
jgi:diphthine-ammonia ligase